MTNKVKRFLYFPIPKMDSKDPSKKKVPKKQAIRLPYTDEIVCKECLSVIQVLRRYHRSIRGGHTLTRTLSGYYPQTAQRCDCRKLEVEVDEKDRLIIKSNQPEQVKIQHRNPKGLLLTISENLLLPLTFDCPQLDSYEPIEYEKQDPYIIRQFQPMANHINLNEFTAAERLLVMPNSDKDREFFFRQYAYTFKIAIFNGSYVYIPTGHRVKVDLKKHPEVRYKSDLTHILHEYMDITKLKSYIKLLIGTLHIYNLHPKFAYSHRLGWNIPPSTWRKFKLIQNLRMELEGITDPRIVASKTSSHLPRPLHTP